MAMVAEQFGRRKKQLSADRTRDKSDLKSNIPGDVDRQLFIDHGYDFIQQ